jgi:hypothetical protein
MLLPVQMDLALKRKKETESDGRRSSNASQGS